jgi:predicted CxxxxCH...CXXCH cytochrome family protein
MKRIVILLCLALLVVISYGCSDSSSDAPAVGKVHPDGWLSMHGAEANDDLRSCQGCHGLDFNGDGDAVSCFNCHTDGPPFEKSHPLGWVDVRQDHQGFPLNYNWTVCATDDCHGVTLQGSRIGPSCFNDSALCHVATGGDPPASHPLPFTSPSAHGIIGKSDLVYCQNCHGRPLNDFLGGYVADLFPDGRPEINDNGNCTQCHPDATSHPTNWTENSNSRDRTHAASGDLETTCVICHNLTIDTTPGNNTPGPFPGAPSCYTVEFTNANGNTSSCHPSGPSDFHDVGQDWLLPSGHVAAAYANDPECFNCHTQTSAGGGIDPACQDCHTAGDPLTVTNCTSCHNIPPDSLPPQGADQPNLAGTHGGHVDFTPTTTDCSACHEGGGTGSLTHYDRVDQTTPNYPAEVVFLPLYKAKTGGETSYNEANQRCSNISCHGGQTSPDWTTGTITVANDCPSCHQLESVSDQYNSYSSGRHRTHAEDGGYADFFGFNPTCWACHDGSKLPASGHFDYLDTFVVEGDPVATLLAGLNYDNTTDPANPTCTDVVGCHGGTRVWGATSGAPHPTDGTYRASTAHGPDAKVNLANCQSCHATPSSGGPNPQFTVNIIQDKLSSSWPARDTTATGCIKCHNTATAHPSAPGASSTDNARWYDAAPDNFNVTHNNAGDNVAATLNATCGLCHPGLTGSVGTVGYDCTFCHVTDPVGDAVGTCTSCHNVPPSGNTAPNRVGDEGRHTRSDHRLACNVCHTSNGPDGTISAANHFTFPIGGNPNFSRANLRPAPIFTPQSMTITQTANNVSCAGSCHNKDHGTKTWY